VAEIVPMRGFPLGLDIGCPSSMVELGAAGCILLIAIRWWVEGYRRSTDAGPRLHQSLEIAGVAAATAPVQAMMETIAETVQRPLAIHAPRCPCLSDDERQLLDAALLAQRGHEALAERALRTALLSAQGAEIAVTELVAIGGLFEAARLCFSRRRVAPHSTMPAELESWKPTHHSGTVH
jgi:hypothetical protein